MDGNEGEPPSNTLEKKRKIKAMINQNKTVKDNEGNPIRQSSSDQNLSGASMSSTENKQCEYNLDIYKDKQITYESYHPGPYYVLVSSTTPVSSIRRNSELFLYERFQKINLPTNYVSKNIGLNLFRLTFNNHKFANDFVTNPRLKEIDLSAYIPDRFVQKFYTITNVPPSFSGEMIKKEIDECNDFDIVSVYRFTTLNEKGKSIPTFTVKIGIITDSVISEIEMFGCKITPRLYIPPLRQCKNCGRLGHIAVRCRSLKRCLICGQSIICPVSCTMPKCNACLSTTKCPDICKNTPRCILCNKTDHTAEDSKKCSKWQTENKIRETMTVTNLSRKEVTNTYSVSNNYYQILSDPKYENAFPAINAKPVRKTVNQEVNERLTRVKYSQVAAASPKTRKPIMPMRDLIVGSPINIEPSKPVFEYSNFQKVTEIERVTSTFAAQMTSLLKSINCSEGLTIMEHFQRSLNLLPSGNKENNRMPQMKPLDETNHEHTSI